MEALNIKIAGLYQIAYNAHAGISFSPEKRANSIVESYEQELNEDLSKMPASEHAQYAENYKKYLFSWLQAKSRIVSPMISGPSNFPTQRMLKYGSWEMKRCDEFTQWRERALNAIAKRIEAAKPEEQKVGERWNKIERDILRSCQTIAEIDAGRTYYSRPLFVSSVTGLIERMAKNGEIELLKRSLDLIKRVNDSSEKPVITAKNKIWALVDQAEAAKEVKEDTQRRENEEFAFSAGTVVFNYQDDRLQIKYEAIPDFETRAKLKRNGFHWSKFNTAWQRQLTENAKYAAKMLTDVRF